MSPSKTSLQLWLIVTCAACAAGNSEEPFHDPMPPWPVSTADAGAASFGDGSTVAAQPGAGSIGAAPTSPGAVLAVPPATGGGTTGSPVSAPTSSAGAATSPGAGGRIAIPGFTGAGGTSGSGGILSGLGSGGFTSGGAPAAPATPLDPSVKQPDPSKLPQVKGTCPNLDRDGSVTINGSTARVWVGSKPGPVYFYWHGTGGVPSEVDQGLPGAAAGTKSNGGIVASWETSNGKGESTGSVWAVWYTGDFEAADQILACGIAKGIVDTGRIHTSGYSAGGLQAGAMLFARSNYIASGIVYSGGKGFGAGRLQDPSNAPPVLGAHGAQGSDTLILDFHDWTMDLEKELKQLGAFAMDCDDGGDHIAFALGARAGVGGKAMQFLKDHPYNTKPSPYASGLPAGYPRNCKIVQ